MAGMLNSPQKGWENLNSGSLEKFASHGPINWQYFTEPPKPPKTPRLAQVDDATAMRNAQDTALRRGRGTTILTSSSGLPNLGSTRAPSAGGY